MKLKYSWIVFILSAILLIPVKLYSAIAGNDFTIGNMPSSTSSSTFITVTIILVLVIIIMSLIPKNDNAQKYFLWSYSIIVWHCYDYKWYS